jgi:long-chain acyl-CoA synthetase
MSLVHTAPASPSADAALEKTLPGRLAMWAKQRPDMPALREKRLGIWQQVTWGEYYAFMQATAAMLKELGIGPGDHIAILSENRPEWLYADLAAQAIGARSVGIYQTNPPEDVRYIVNHSRSRILFCEDQEQVDKAIAIRAETPDLEKIIVFESRGLRGYGDDRLLFWEDFLARGRELIAASPGMIEAELLQLKDDEPSMVVYTSGTTGNPKGALLTSRNVLVPARQTVDMLGFVGTDTVLSYLPLCHVAEKIFSLYLPLTSAAIVHFGEAIETVQEDLRQVSPTVFLGVPRIWEKMHATVQIKMRDASWTKRKLYDYWTEKGAEIAGRRRAGKATAVDAALWFVGDMLVFRPLQERLGLRNCRLAISGAAPISANLLEWYHGIGVEILEGYGQTEGAGVSHLNIPGAVQLGTVGRMLPGVECQIAEDGEILVRGANVFPGYLHNEEATRETVDAEGWLHTGDVGVVAEDGYLRITGRKKEIIITSGGKNLSPEKIENALKMSPYIKEAIAIGDQRNYVAALIQIEADTVGSWATRQKITFTSYGDLAGKPEVEKLVAAEVEKANALLARVESVRAFGLLPRELKQDDGELTATQKVRRRAVVERYADVIEKIYAGGRKG